MLRERSWREGDWSKLTNANNAARGSTLQSGFYADLNDHVASQRLPLLCPPVTEHLVIPSPEEKGAIAAESPSIGGPVLLRLLWTRSGGSDAS